MHERQAVVFGILIAALSVAGLGAAAVFTGTLDLPFLTREFSTAPPTTVAAAPVPCPPEGALPVAYADITTNVYNGAGRPGLAAQTRQALEDRGFVVVETGNAASFDGTARVTFGVEGIAQAYTVAAQVQDAVLLMDAREGSDVSIIVGDTFAALLPLDQVPLAPDEPLVAPAGCRPAESITPAPVVTPTPPAEATEDADEG